MYIAVCDDCQNELDSLRTMLEIYGASNPELALRISLFSDPRHLLETVEREGGFDIYLLDILMPGLSGLDLARALQMGNYRPYLIFLTISREYALEAFSVRAQNYLLKPLAQPALFAALDRTVEDLQGRKDDPVTIFGAKNATSVVPRSSIAYVECQNHTFTYHLVDGTALESRTLRDSFSKSMSPFVDSGYFVQPHQSFVVNMYEISRLSERTITLIRGVQIPIARQRVSQVRAAYMEFLRRKELSHA